MKLLAPSRASRTLAAAVKLGASLPPFSWFSNDVPIVLAKPDGRLVLCQSGETKPISLQKARRRPFWAIELPEDMVLFRDIDIPIQNAEEKAAATSLAVQMLSPFAHEDGVWGVGSVLGRDTTMAAIASRNHIRQYAQRFSESHGMDAVRDVAHCEVWCCPANALPVVLVGFAEPMRYRQVRRNRWLSHIALAVCLLVAAAILATPLAQLALKAESAQKQGHAAQVETRSAQALREALLSNQAKLVSVSKISLESQQPPEILARVTAVVPDDTWVQRLQWQSGKVTLQGQTPNVATLMASLSKQPDIKEVKAPAAATKSAGSGKENFSVEFVLLPAAASVVGGGNGVGPGESGAP